MFSSSIDKVYLQHVQGLPNFGQKTHVVNTSRDMTELIRHVHKVSKIVVAKLRESKYRVLTVVIIQIFLECDTRGRNYL